MEKNPGAALADALKTHGYGRSLSNAKLMILMSGLANIPWDNVKAFKLDWKVLDVDGDEHLVPVCQLAMHDGTTVVEAPDPDHVQS